MRSVQYCVGKVGCTNRLRSVELIVAHFCPFLSNSALSHSFLPYSHSVTFMVTNIRVRMSASHKAIIESLEEERKILNKITIHLNHVFFCDAELVATC